jgi:hypothetical protein
MQYSRITLHFDAPQVQAPTVPGALTVSGSGREWGFLCNQPIKASFLTHVIDDQPASLSDIFVGIAGGVHSHA